MSACESCSAFYKPVHDDIKILPEEFISARQSLKSKQSFAEILRFKSFAHRPIGINDLLEAFFKSSEEKRSK